MKQFLDNIKKFFRTKLSANLIKIISMQPSEILIVAVKIDPWVTGIKVCFNEVPSCTCTSCSYLSLVLRWVMQLMTLLFLNLNTRFFLKDLYSMQNHMTQIIFGWSGFLFFLMHLTKLQAKCIFPQTLLKKSKQFWTECIYIYWYIQQSYKYQDFGFNGKGFSACFSSVSLRWRSLA